MKKLVCSIVLCLSIVTTVYATNDAIKFVSDLYFSPQSWPDIGDSSDPKFGLGVGGMFGIVMTPIENMPISIGPHFGVSFWSADYSKKSGGATDSVFVNLSDIGMETHLGLGNDSYFIFGAGITTLNSGMIAGGTTYTYPGLAKAEYQYTTAGLSFKLENFYIAPVVVNYSGYAHYANRVEIRCGTTF